MRPLVNSNRPVNLAWARQLAWTGALTLGLCGCANFWDDVTSHDHKWGSMFSRRPDPLSVLKDSTDGNERHKALAALEEPLQHGGSQQDQDMILGILEASATNDREPLCRLAALRTLGTFKDPRAPKILANVYLKTLGELEANSTQPIGLASFTPPQTSRVDNEHYSLICQQCLDSLAETGGPIALDLLVTAANEPPSKIDARITVDRRIKAVRCLAKFRDPKAAAALAKVLKEDKDIALRDRAYESLQQCTGRQLPSDSPQWAAYLPPESPPVQQHGGQYGVIPASAQKR